jgi:hypothetical protein
MKLIDRFRAMLQRTNNPGELGMLYHSVYRGTRVRVDGRIEHVLEYGMIETPPEYAEVYARRGMTVPAVSSSFDPASLWPYEPREPHETYARARGYFWLPCRLCGRSFGGHEITDSVHFPDNAPGISTGICPLCTAVRNGGRP